MGDTVLTQNDERITARLQEASANIRRIEAALAEQLQGPRVETIAVARATLKGRAVEYDFRVRELERLVELRDRNLTSAESVDLARKLMDSAAASSEVARAQLRELEAGTRSEQIDQTRYSLQQGQARLVQVQIEQQRLTITTSVAGIVDSLPFEVGERPAIGDVVAVLLSGAQPHARIYVPEIYRVNVAPGDSVQVVIDGLDNVLTGTVRRIENDASFTPYFALTESDRGRLSYVAEITLPELPNRLPDGMPVEIFFAGMPVTDDE